MHVFSTICSLILTGYIAFEALRSPGKYRQFKQAVNTGTPGARKSFYCEILWFEWITAILAVAALRFAPSNFDPARLELNSSSFGTWWLSFRVLANRDFIYGVGAGLLIVVSLLFFIMNIARRRWATTKTVPRSPSRLSGFLPDFSYLLPRSTGERWLFALVAVSAGICEEVVFRGWVLTSLHSFFHFYGWPLVLIGSGVFGALHAYQGILGIVSTVILALALTGFYVAAGSLLVPIAVHVLVDLRWAVFPNALGLPAAGAGQNAD